MVSDEFKQERRELRDFKLAHFGQCEERIATQKAERLEQNVGTIDRIIDHCVEKTYKVSFER